MLNSITTSAHNVLPPAQVARLLAGALLLATAALTGCNSTPSAAASEPTIESALPTLAAFFGHAHTGPQAVTASAHFFTPSHRHTHTRELSSRAEIPQRHPLTHAL